MIDLFRLICNKLIFCAFLNPAGTSSLDSMDGRIVGGENTTIEEYPYQVP